MIQFELLKPRFLSAFELNMLKMKTTANTSIPFLNLPKELKQVAMGNLAL